ncbi:MAG: four helix bundle protein [Candidatus Omnitrophica bacterium]|nr:four helix bundle protein [Candidatus Omnitrophota bacterium]
MAFKFEKLKVWEEAVKFANEIYAITRKFPKSEQFGLTSQLNRAAVSISLNIAEGEGRNSNNDFARFIQIAIGSLNETVTLLYIALEQKYINKKEFDNLYLSCETISKQLHAFRNYLKKQ